METATNLFGGSLWGRTTSPHYVERVECSQAVWKCEAGFLYEEESPDRHKLVLTCGLGKIHLASAVVYSRRKDNTLLTTSLKKPDGDLCHRFNLAFVLRFRNYA
jgi:hypothetical protein